MRYHYQLLIKSDAGMFLCTGICADSDWDAIEAGMHLCPGATHVTPRRLP